MSPSEDDDGDAVALPMVQVNPARGRRPPTAASCCRSRSSSVRCSSTSGGSPTWRQAR